MTDLEFNPMALRQDAGPTSAVSQAGWVWQGIGGDTGRAAGRDSSGIVRCGRGPRGPAGQVGQFKESTMTKGGCKPKVKQDKPKASPKSGGKCCGK